MEQSQKYNKKHQELDLYDLGKIPPQAIDLEEAILGAIMLEQHSYSFISHIISTPDVFYKDSNQKVFSAIIDLINESKNVDMLTVMNKLQQKGELEIIGGAYALTVIIQKVATSAHILDHAKIVYDKYIARKRIAIASEIIHQSYDDSIDISETGEYIETELFNLSNQSKKSTITRVDKIIPGIMSNINKLASKEIEFTGVPSGLTKLDRVTSGWQNTDLIILAARPGMGKTSEALFFAINAAKQKFPVAIYSLEMSKEQLAIKSICFESFETPMNMRIAKIKSWDKLNSSIGKFVNLPLYIDDTPALSIFELKSRIRSAISHYGIKLIFVDYLQLMAGTEKRNGNREQEISSISRGLKAIAKEFNIPIIALSQLSRACESRADKRPMLSDLRESGAIEQDADMVIFLFRPEYYGIKTIEIDGEWKSAIGLIENNIAKHRNGGLATIDSYCNEEITKFFDTREELEDFSAKRYNIINSDPRIKIEDMRPNNDFDRGPF